MIDMYMDTFAVVISSRFYNTRKVSDYMSSAFWPVSVRLRKKKKVTTSESSLIVAFLLRGAVSQKEGTQKGHLTGLPAKIAESV